MEDEDPTPNRIYTQGITEDGNKIHFRDYPRLSDRHVGHPGNPAYILREIRPLDDN